MSSNARLTTHRQQAGELDFVTLLSSLHGTQASECKRVTHSHTPTSDHLSVSCVPQHVRSREPGSSKASWAPRRPRALNDQPRARPPHAGRRTSCRAKLEMLFDDRFSPWLPSPPPPVSLLEVIVSTTSAPRQHHVSSRPHPPVSLLEVIIYVTSSAAVSRACSS